MSYDEAHHFSLTRVTITFSIVLLTSSSWVIGDEVRSEDSNALAQFTEPELSLTPATVSLAANQQPAQDKSTEGKTVNISTKEPEPYNILTTKKLTGDWFGVCTALENIGIDFSPLLGVEYEQNFRGGQNTHNAHNIAGIWFYNLELDFEKMLKLKGATFFFRAVQSWDDGIGADVGSLVPPYWTIGSSGDRYFGDPDCILVNKWWYRQRLFDDRLEFRLGKLLNVLDLFDKNEYAGTYVGQFMNRALNHHTNFPAKKGIGAFVKIWPTDWLYFQASAIDPDARPTRTGFDTAFHGHAHFFANWEFGLTPKWQTAKGKLPGNYKFGWWYDPKTMTIFKNTLSGSLHDEYRTGDVGFYLTFDQLIWKENDNPKDKQGLGAFFNYGYAHGDVNRINHFWSIGSQYEGLIPTRDADVLGFGVAQSMLSTQYRHEINNRADRETVYELYYAVKITPWCVVTPDVQVITNPGGNKDARDVLVGGLRVKIVF